MSKKESSRRPDKNPYTGEIDRLGGKKLVQHGSENFQKLQQKHKHGTGGPPRKSS